MKKFNIDELFRNSLDENIHDFQESSWENFKILREQETRKRRYRIFYLCFALIGIAFLSSGAYNKLLNKKDNSNKVVKKQETRLENKSGSIQNLDAQKNVSEKSITTFDQKIKVNQDEKSPNHIFETTKSLLNTSKGLNTIKTINNKQFEDKLSNEVSFISRDSKPSFLIPQTIKSKTEIAQLKTGDSYDQLATLLPVKRIFLKTINRKKVALNLFPVLKKAKNKTKAKKLNIPKGFLLGAGIAMGNEKHQQYFTSLQNRLSPFKNWSIDAGLQYSLTRAGDLPEHRKIDARYNFGTTSFYSSSIAADDLHHISIPIHLNRHFGKSQLSIGIDYRYLFLVRGTIISDESGMSVIKSTWIVEKGLYRHSANAILGYTYSLGNNFELQAGLQIGLRDIYEPAAIVNRKLNAGFIRLKYFLKK